MSDKPLQRQEKLLQPHIRDEDVCVLQRDYEACVHGYTRPRLGVCLHRREDKATEEHLRHVPESDYKKDIVLSPAWVSEIIERIWNR